MSWPENVPEFDHTLSIPLTKGEYDAIMAEAAAEHIHPLLLLRVWCCPSIGHLGAHQYLRPTPEVGTP